MDQAVKSLDARVTAAESLAWNPPDGRMSQPVDRAPLLALHRNTRPHLRGAA